MAWRGVHITQPAALSFERNALKVDRRGEDTVTVPLEDVGWIIVDTHQATLTTRLIAECTDNGVCLIISDARHHPASMVLPRSQYHRQLATVRAHLNLGDRQKGQLWKRLIHRKITNQAHALSEYGSDDGAAKAVGNMAGRVRNADPENIEALAAQSYWPALFPDLVRRNDNDGRNAHLNYGYAITRALIARTLAALGFEMSLGINHANTLNPYNLADDLLEPFRPLVDGYVFAHLDNTNATTSPDVAFDVADRQHLAALPQLSVRLGGESLSLFNAATDVAAALRTAIVDGTPDALVLPEPLAS